MNDLKNMIWVEFLKLFRSRLSLWTLIACLPMPLGVAFLIFVAKNPEISQKSGLISAKANLLAYAAIDWPAYLSLLGQTIAAGGFIIFILIISWVFGREFVDGTLKDFLALPIRRSDILMAKFIVSAAWCGVLSLVIFLTGFITGALIRLPGWDWGMIMEKVGRLLVMDGLVILMVLPFALLACVGRGYLLPVGGAILILIMTNVIAMAGWGEVFPWAIPGLFIQGKDPLPIASYLIVLATSLAGLAATYVWWKVTDQTR